MELKIVYEDADCLVIDKPSGLPTVPLKHQNGCTLLSLVGERFPEVLAMSAYNSWEGSVLHRLDTETSGLVLFARTRDALLSLKLEQDAQRILKGYTITATKNEVKTGFPPFPYGSIDDETKPTVIRSMFRPYGEKRRAVRPVLAASGMAARKKSSALWYETLVRFEGMKEGEYKFFAEIVSGFRHQIRCHLAWAGFPLLGDTLYGGPAGKLQLRATSLAFTHPATGRLLELFTEEEKENE